MDWLRGLGKLIRQVRPPTVYLVARLTRDQAAAVAAFREPDGAARFLVQHYRRRIGRPAGSSAPPSFDEIVQAYQSLNNTQDGARHEFWTIVPAELAPPGDKPIPFRLQAELFDLSVLGDDDRMVASCDLPGISIIGGEVDRRGRANQTERPAPAPDTIEQVYIVTEWLHECDLSCFVFDDVATAKRYTIEWHNEDADDTTDDFRTAFRGLNRSEDESAFSLCTIRLGRGRLTPILNGAEPTRRAGAGIGFCDLPDIRVGQALPLDD